VAYTTKALPVVDIPEQFIVPLVWLDMVEHLGGRFVA
jgi:hypothetical protein